MRPFRFDESRKQRAEGQSIDIARWDAGEQRLGEVSSRLVPESARHEGADRFVFVIAAGRDKELSAHAELARPGKKTRAKKWTDLGRDAEHRCGRQRMKRA